MGSDADADISFGVAFDEDQDFPWTENGDIEDWWRQINGLVPLYDYECVKNLGLNCGYTARFKDGRALTETEVAAHYKHKADWMKDNPLPVKEVFYGSGYGSSATVLAVPSSVIRGSWDSPTKFDSGKLVVSPEELAAFKQFMETYLPDAPKDYGWMLTAFYG